jgi:hypothetical protein
MTKPITHRPLRKAGRKPVNAPAEAAQRIRALASDGFSIVGVAAAMGVGKDQLGAWMERDPTLKEAFDEGRETERQTLHNQLFRLAMEKGNAPAAMFLLKARHGYREGDQSDQAGRVNVTIALPGAMTLQQFNALSKEGTRQ